MDDISLKMPRQIFNDMIDQACREQPWECCGLLGGRDLVVHHRYPLENRSPQPETRYFAAPDDIFEATRQMRAVSEELIAIYHSHPQGPAYPSPSDIELAYYPQAFYLIIVVEPRIEMRAFTIQESAVTEVPIDLLM
ncbi:MAG TPA: M67 family metallopeptidase [Blastocatellia bacterium]|nr:M67 family metallopeptidase [Blastocatellia bacterium]